MRESCRMFLPHRHPLHLFKKHRNLLMVAGIFGALVSIGTTLFFPFFYRADAQVLIISKSRYGVDPYTVVKSAERVGENIAEVIKTDDFFNKVMSAERYAFDRSPFEQVNPRLRRRRWTRAVEASVVYGTGILNVSAYGVSADDATALASAVVDTLAARGWEYVGGDVTLKVVNQPTATRFPVRPNLLLNGLFGFFAGALLAVALLLRRGA